MLYRCLVEAISLSINRACVHLYLVWTGRSRTLAPVLAHAPHPTVSSCIEVSTDEGLKDGQVLYTLFRKGKQRAIPESLHRIFQGHGKTYTRCSEEQMKFPAFIGSKSLSLSKLKLHKFIHMVKMPLKRDKFSQKGPKQTGPSPLKYVRGELSLLGKSLPNEENMNPFSRKIFRKNKWGCATSNKPVYNPPPQASDAIPKLAMIMQSPDRVLPGSGNSEVTIQGSICCWPMSHNH